ncbi:MAG: vWA domain-containing protein [Pseudomarimonas sp.]
MKSLAWGVMVAAACVVSACSQKRTVREEVTDGRYTSANLERPVRTMAQAPDPLAIEVMNGVTVSGTAYAVADLDSDTRFARLRSRSQSELGSETARAPLQSNPWLQALTAPTSTFSIDVDTGSYSLVRRLLRDGALPTARVVRSEEFLNYFDYGYTPPSGIDTPFSITTEIAPVPWSSQRQLLLVGLKGIEVDVSDLPAANLVFLIDTSGSMQSADKLALLRTGFRALVENLRPQDRVAIVAYAGSAGLVLPSTAGDNRGAIFAALDALQAGGSTNGGAGIDLAYRVAAESRIPGGINRVILASDGDFNVGTTSIVALKELVATQRAGGTALTTLGFGAMGYNEEVAEQLADIGNGHYAYIDDELEARKVLVKEMGGTLLTIAKDVKIQVEFNPLQVSRYRLLGYENRLLNREDFANDRVDAGEIGAGHDVTALYELELSPNASPQQLLASLRLRYKRPDEDNSRLIEQRLLRGEVRPIPSDRLGFAAAVVGFAEKLRGNADLADFTYLQLIDLFDAHSGASVPVERSELRDLIELAGSL